MKEKIELIDPKFTSWESSRRGPCNCWYGAGCSAEAKYVGSDGNTYTIRYSREFPYGTEYSVLSESGKILETFDNLRTAAKSVHLAAFRALRAYAVGK